MKKYINTVGWVIGMLMGTLMGLCLTLWMTRETQMETEEAFELGKKEAQQECVDLIRSTNH